MREQDGKREPSRRSDEPGRATREMLVEVPDPRLGAILMPGIVPKLSRTPGSIRWAGPDLGADTAEVLRRLLGSDQQSPK